MNSMIDKKVTHIHAPKKRADYLDYEAAKRAWCRMHPNASPLDYQRAMRQIGLWLNSNADMTAGKKYGAL